MTQITAQEKAEKRVSSAVSNIVAELTEVLICTTTSNDKRLALLILNSLKKFACYDEKKNESLYNEINYEIYDCACALNFDEKPEAIVDFNGTSLKISY